MCGGGGLGGKAQECTYVYYILFMFFLYQLSENVSL